MTWTRTITEDQNTITVNDGGDSMCDSDDGAVGKFYTQGLLDHIVGSCVH